jgi:hypothetical protein
MTDLENLAREGYEIHGSKHATLVQRAWKRGFFVGAVSVVAIDIALDLLRLLV